NRRLVRLGVAHPRERHRGGVEIAAFEQAHPVLEELVDVVLAHPPRIERRPNGSRGRRREQRGRARSRGRRPTGKIGGVLRDVLAVLAVTSLLGLAAAPIARAVLAPLHAGAAGFARPLGILLAATALWLCASVGLL